MTGGTNLPTSNTSNNLVQAATTMLPEPDLDTMSRRFPGEVPWPSLISVVRPIGRTSGILRCPRDISREQLRWRKYCQEVRGLCSFHFWQFFLPLHTLSRSAVDTALRCAKTTFSGSHAFTRFPTTTRTLFRKMREKVCVLRGEFGQDQGPGPYLYTTYLKCDYVLMSICLCPHAGMILSS